MSSRIAVIAIDAVEPRVVADFWCAVLRWRVVEADHDASASLRRTGRGHP